MCQNRHRWLRWLHEAHPIRRFSVPKRTIEKVRIYGFGMDKMWYRNVNLVRPNSDCLTGTRFFICLPCQMHVSAERSGFDWGLTGAFVAFVYLGFTPLNLCGICLSGAYFTRVTNVPETIGPIVSRRKWSHTFSFPKKPKLSFHLLFVLHIDLILYIYATCTLNRIWPLFVCSTHDDRISAEAMWCFSGCW